MRVKLSDDRLNKIAFSFGRYVLLVGLCAMAISFAVIACHPDNDPLSFLRMVFDIGGVERTHPEDFNSLRWTCFGAFNVGVQVALMVYVAVTMVMPRRDGGLENFERVFHWIAAFIVAGNLIVTWPYWLAYFDLSWEVMRSDGFLASPENDPRCQSVLVATVLHLATSYMVLAVAAKEPYHVTD